MKARVCGLIIIVMFSFSSMIFAEVYTWVDEKGQKHFGDRIPNAYKDQSKPIDIKIHQPSEEDVDRAGQSNRNITRMNSSLERKQRSKPASSKIKPRQNQPATSNKTYAEMSCAQQKNVYAKSDACYASCANKTMIDHKIRINTAGGGVVVDSYKTGRSTAGCEHCGDYPKPKICQ